MPNQRRTPYSALLDDISAAYGLPVDLLEAQVLQESNGKADAFRYEPAFYRRYLQTNTQGAGFSYGPLAACSYGLLQIMLETAIEVGYRDRPERLFDPRIGLTWGATYLRRLLETYGGDYERALAAYNGGPGAVDHGQPYATAAYVASIYALAGRALSIGNRA